MKLDCHCTGSSSSVSRSSCRPARVSSAARSESRPSSSPTAAPSEFKNNLYDSAEKDLKQAIQTDPTYEIAYYNLGKVFQKQRKWDKAIEYFEQAVQRKPDNANYQYDLGEAYLESKKIDQAEKALEAATAADAKLFKAWWRLGLVYKMLDRPKEADDALRHAIEANPRFSKSYVALGYLYLDYDFNKEAAQVFQGCVTAKEDDGECHNGYGLALKNLKQYEQATNEFKKAIDLDPELYDALYNAAWRTPTGSTRRTATTRRKGARVPAEVRYATAPRPPTATTSRRPTTSCTRSLVRSIRAPTLGALSADYGRPQRESDREPSNAFPVAFLFLAGLAVL